MEKSEKKEFPIVDNMEKTNEEQADKSVEEDEKIYEEELTLHPEFDFTQRKRQNIRTSHQEIRNGKTSTTFSSVGIFWTDARNVSFKSSDGLYIIDQRCCPRAH